MLKRNCCISRRTRLLLFFMMSVMSVNFLQAQTFYVNDNSLAGDVFGAGIGNNANPGTLASPFATIQFAVNTATAGSTIIVESGIYDEKVVINKALTITGAGSTNSMVNFTGTVTGRPALFDITANGVFIQNMAFSVDLSKLRSAILASAAAIDAVTVNGNNISAYGTPAGSYGDRNAVSVNYSGPTNYRVATGGVNSIIFNNNVISGTAPASYFRAGLATDESGLSASGNTLQTINHDILSRFGSNGNITISSNNFNGGGLEVSELNAGAGVLTINGNSFDGTAANVSAPGAAVLRLLNNYNSKTTNISGNTFINHEWAVSLANYNSVTLNSNSFTPLAGSTTFHHVAINTKSISTNSALITQVSNGATLTNNTFNGSGTPGGTAVSFHNHDNITAIFGSFTIGSSGNANDFADGIANYIYLDNATGASTGSSFPNYNSLIGVGANAITTMACWTPNINIENNRFDVGAGLQLPSAMSGAQLGVLESRVFHKPDASCLGVATYANPVHNLTQNTYYSTIQSAVTAANPNDVIECLNWTFNEKVVINKSLTLQGSSEAGSIINGTGLGNGSGIYINSGISNVTIRRFTIQNHAGTNPNSFAGIYGAGNNNNLTVEDCTIKNNVGGSGFYANGPVNGVTLNNLDVSGHTNAFGVARGIVIWNGLKQNISISNCDVYNNNCCGIELQDGTATGVTLLNNNVYNNSDNGLGLNGLQGPGANLVNLNTVTNNGRFGIEVKNPNGSGASSGAGSVVISNNTVSRSVPIGAELRDIAGIAVFRRGVLTGNVDIPFGVWVSGNNVSGYTQPSNSDGFGIVAEGVSHTITGNTVSGNDVGIQRQAGHLPYPGDGNQNNLADTYFGRGNSPVTCGVTVNGNTLSNTIDTRDVGPVTSITASIINNSGSTELNCSFASISVTATGGTIYSWDGGLGNNANATITAPGTYTVTVSDANGCSGQASIVITQGPLVAPGQATVTGFTNVCPYAGYNIPVTYTASATNATGYNWVVPPNVNIISGQGTANLTVTFNAGFIAQANKQLRVTSTNSCGNGPLKIYYLLAQFPTTPAPIVASTLDVCPSLGTNVPITFTIPKVQSATSYIWTAQAGSTTITHPNGLGVNDTTISVTFSNAFTSSAITVTAVNDCGSSGVRSLTLSRSNPSTPGLISGPTNSCDYIDPSPTQATYTVALMPNVTTYTWTIPMGSTNISGQGTNSISFNYPIGYTGGNISVVASNGCGTSAVPRTLNITSYKPATPSVIDVIETVACPNREYTYSLSSLPANASSVNWTVPAGATILSGQGTISITVSYPSTAISGTVTATGVNLCGNSVSRSVSVKLPACPDPFAKPNGYEYSKVQAPVGTDTDLDVSIFPNPAKGAFNLSVRSNDQTGISQIRILDLQGRVVLRAQAMPNTIKTLGQDLKPGVYQVEIVRGSTRVVKKLIRQ